MVKQIMIIKYILVTKEDKLYCAHYLPLDLVDTATTEREACEKVKATLAFYLKCLLYDIEVAEEELLAFRPAQLKYWLLYFLQEFKKFNKK